MVLFGVNLNTSDYLSGYLSRWPFHNVGNCNPVFPLQLVFAQREVDVTKIVLIFSSPPQAGTKKQLLMFGS